MNLADPASSSVLVMSPRRFNALIPDGGSNFAAAVVRCLAAVPGCQPRVLARSRWVPVHFSRHVVGRMIWRGNASDYAVNVERAVRRWGPAMLVPTGCLATEATISRRAELGAWVSLPPLPSQASFQTCLDKCHFSRFLLERNLPHPPTSVIEGDAAHPDPWALEFPLLYKPALGSYGIGIQEIVEGRGLETLLATCRQRRWRGVLQSYIPGDDIDLSVLAQEGRIVAHTIQRGLLPPRRRYGPSSFVEFALDPAVLALGARLIQELGWSGVGHIDLRRDGRDGKLQILELNPRYWGSVHASAWAGVNFPELACALGMGHAFPAPKMRPCRYASLGVAVNCWTSGLPQDGPMPRWNEIPILSTLTDPGPMLAEFAWKSRGRFLPDFAAEDETTTAAADQADASHPGDRRR